MKKKKLIIGMIFLISIFLIMIIPLISASTCCQRTKAGAWCQQIENSNECATSDKNVPTSCEATSYCRTGICIDSVEGTCMPSSQAACEYNDGYWDERSKDEIPQCQLGCCFFPNGQTSFVTQIRCQKLSSDYGLTTNFRADIDTQDECFASAMPSVKGACVYEKDFQKGCELITKKECQEIEKNTAYSNVEFRGGYLCSAKILGTNCGIKGGTTCGDDGRVYFKDTCGNLANVYDSSKLNDENYWTYIQEPECSSLDAKDSASCGNCDYTLGSTCRAKEIGDNVDYGSYICRDLDCKDYTGTEFQGRDPSYPMHGESWCADSRGVGTLTAERDSDGNIIDKTGGDDYTKENLPGSRYFKLVCYNGEVIVDSCAEYREEVCIETEIGETEFKHAECRKNLLLDCPVQTKEEDCEDRETRDCKWLDVGYYFSDQGLKKSETGTPTGVCVPRYAPGFDLESSSSAENADICSLGSSTCVIIYKAGIFRQKKLKKLLAKDFNDMTLAEKQQALDERKEWCNKGIRDRCDNEYCFEALWEDTINNICTALGDCGEKINYIGKEGGEIGLEIISPAGV